jgi:hypothetical protein
LGATLSNVSLDESTVLNFLESVPDGIWDDTINAHKYNSLLLKSIASSKSCLRFLVERIASTPDLLELCEVDHFRYKLVLFASAKKDYRLRLHIWNNNAPETVHNHRFAYTSMILAGGYEHRMYSTNQDLFPENIGGLPELSITTRDAKDRKLVDVDSIKTSIVFNIQVGQSFTQLSEPLSSTIVLPNTISLFVRGPACRQNAFQWDREADLVVWRRGAEAANENLNNNLRMSLSTLNECMDFLNRAGII